MSETLSLFFDALVTCLQAAPLTLMLTALSVGIGLCMAIPLSVVHQRERTPGARLVHAFTYFFTGTPLLVQIYIIYYGIPSFHFIGQLMSQPGFGFLKEGFIWVLVALTLNTAAYSTVIFSGAIKNTDRGEIEAARAYGMNRRNAMRRIILPSSLRRALPAYSNEVIMTMHSTALASTVAMMEITGAASLFVTTTYQPFIAYSAAACIYLVLNFVLVFIFRKIEQRYLVHLNSRNLAQA
ncbi:nickel transporter [Advenella sp. S44]|uniref:ABC transporter permease n=1 Tax=Advenella sp. S44 TaxID=1982755 RepID=UPI000C29A9D0|nr:ABC transporter permease subunit [Advenella sp. S44]PJX25858.1 nickel transporter [Advenella sp. S44]